MGVFKNRGTPKWMVKIMENPIKMDDLGVPHGTTILGNIYICQVKDSLFSSVMTKVIKHEVCQVKRSIKKNRGDR